MTTASRPRHSVLLLGVPVDDVTMDETIDLLFDLAEDGRAAGRIHQVATVNVDFVVNATRDDELLAIMRTTSLSIPDGMPVVWTSRWLGTGLRERVTGADLVSALAERARDRGTRLLLLGAGPGIADRAAQLLRERFSGLDVVADAGPAFDEPGDIPDTEIERLQELRADVCCVAFGNPKQERFIAHWGRALGIPVMIGVGGSLDFLVGHKRRAPVWMQRSGLEWVHRMVTEPRRLMRRYITDVGRFLPAVAAQLWRGRPSRRVGDAAVERADDGSTSIDLSGLSRADNRTASQLVSAVRSAQRIGARVEILGDPAGLDAVEGLRPVILDHPAEESSA
jgi:N-acetylglucosaminyldiphosphoundecaprenol N-acetyl-beta-D-mannosaminyltransferase